jgi:hypothetical protein
MKLLWWFLAVFAAGGGRKAVGAILFRKEKHP